MSRLVLDGITDVDRLVETVARLLAHRRDAALYDHEELLYRPNDTVPFIPPTGYIRCTDRGTHRILTECWMCWNDVMHGVTTERNVLAVDATPTRSATTAVTTNAIAGGER